MMKPSDAYTLTVRQGPERARVFAGLKEKGKPPFSLSPSKERLIAVLCLQIGSLSIHPLSYNYYYGILWILPSESL